MANLDAKEKNYLEGLRQMVQSDDPEQRAAAAEQMFEDFRQQVLTEARACAGVTDSAVLAQRGVRQLTTSERGFYQKLVDAQQSGITNIAETIPETIIEQVVEDVQADHPLLGALKIVNTNGRTKWILNATGAKLAVWGQITSAITNELEAAISVVDFGTNKLSAFMFVPKDIIALGAEWIDRYVRLILADALATGLSDAAINGTGKNQPIGATRNLNGAVVNGVYPEKTAVALTSLTPLDYCAAIAPMTVNALTSRPRAVSEVILICNPTDYVSKIIPCTTVLAADGSYKGNVFPFPTTVVPEERMTQGKAVLMIKDGYNLFITGAEGGMVDVSDEYKFLEDYRTYLAKMYAYGRANDNNATVLLDISGLEPANLKVDIVSSPSSNSQSTADASNDTPDDQNT